MVDTRSLVIISIIMSFICVILAAVALSMVNNLKTEVYELQHAQASQHN